MSDVAKAPTNDDVGAHHGPPIITSRDLAICQALVKWIQTARAAKQFGYPADWLPSDVDILKSRLFWRLRTGKEPLPHPPPTAYSCPWYEVVEETDRPHWAYELWVHEGAVIIAQCGYAVEQWAAPTIPEIVTFGPYRFRVWQGESPYNAAAALDAAQPPKRPSGWWIQRIPEVSAT